MVVNLPPAGIAVFLFHLGWEFVLVVVGGLA
jgi:hypothetical protein